MKTKSLAMATVVGAVAVVALLFAYPAMASSTSVPQNPSIQQLVQQLQSRPAQKLQLSVGQTLVLTSVAGGYKQVGDSAVNGTATGTMTLKVTGTFTAGYSLSITSGTISLGGTTYAVSGGSAELGPYGAHMVGQGQAGSTAQFLFTATNLGRFGSTAYGVLRIDLTNGLSEFAVRLLVTISA
jgi:hypothetical protein